MEQILKDEQILASGPEVASTSGINPMLSPLTGVSFDTNRKSASAKNRFPFFRTMRRKHE